MENITWFGILYIALSVVGVALKISEIGKLRKPVTYVETVALLISSILILWGLFTVGVEH